MPIYPDDDDLAAALTARRQHQAALRARVTPQQAQLAAANAGAYRHLRPGDVTALAKAGFGPEHPGTKQVAETRARVKVKKGFGFHSIGDVISGGAQLAKGAARAGFTLLAAPYEEAQGIVRNLAAGSGPAGGAAGGAGIGAGIGAAVGAPFFGVGAAAGAGVGALIGGAVGGIAGVFADDDIEGKAKWQSQSSAGVALGRLLRGKDVNLGSGFFPGGEVHKEQVRRAQQVTIGGHALTPGRLTAAAITEPGTDAYRRLSGVVDFAGALTADPSNIAGGQIGKARRAARMFTPEDVGAINGLRRTVQPDRVAEFLNHSPEGQALIDGLAADKSFDSIWRRSGKKLSVEDALALSKMDNTDDIRAYLDPRLGVNYREKPELKDLPFQNPIVRRVRDARLWQGMPGDYVRFDDPDQAVEQVDRFLRNANIRDPELIAKHTTAIAEAAVNGSPADRFGAITAVADVVKDVIAGANPSKARTQAAHQMTTLWANRIQELTKFNVDDIGNNVNFPGVKVNGANVPAASPHLVVEALQSRVPLPDARDIRAATSRFAPLLDHPVIRIGTLAADHLMQLAWKPLVLIRGAWPIRVVGEEQLRMAAAGFDSFANHPLSAVATVIGDDGKFRSLLGRTGIKPRAEVDVLGEAFRTAAERAPDPTAFEQALYQGRVADPVGKARRVMSSNKTLYQKFETDYGRAWASELMQLRTDPLARRLAEGESVDDLTTWLVNGPGDKIRRDLLTQGIDTSTGPSTRAYVQTIADRIATKTGQDPGLLEMLRTGMLDGESMRVGEKINPSFIEKLDDMRDIGPTVVKGELFLADAARSELSQRLDHAVNWMFEQLMVKTSNELSRSTTFRQSYWQRIEELVPFMDEATQTAAITAAAEANLGKAALKRFADRALSARGSLTSLEQADLVAKGHALETTRDLLYDLADRGQFGDVTRLIFPFAEAWKEVITRWVKLVGDRPNLPRRAQQVITGARGAGWFHPDPVSGEEVFNYPGTDFLSEHLLGVRVPLTGRVAGLSLATNVLPGFGPVVQIPASKIIPDTPDWDWAREAFLPFGEPQTEGGFAESFLPAWIQKFRTAFFKDDPENNRQFANTMMDVARYLVSTGDYSTNDHDEVARLLRDAKSKAKGLYLIRGAAQFWAPSAPTPEFLAKDKDGHFVVAAKLVEEYHQLQELDRANGTDEAVEKFMDTFGEQALLFMQPKTQGGPPPTENLGDWARGHTDQVSKYKDVYSFFGPQGGEFDLDFYSNQIRTGARKPVTPEDAVKFANHRVASMVYRNAKEQVANRTDSDAQRWLAQIRDSLIAEYPGYDPMSFDIGRVPRMIREIERAAADPVMAETDAGQAITVYLDAREKAIEASKALGLNTGFGKAKAAAHLRDWLRGIGASLIEEHPDFRSVWDSVFDREMVRDDVQGQVA